MALREEDQRQVVAILRQYSQVQHGNAVAAAARLTDKQKLALLAEYREKIKPVVALADAAFAASEKAKPVTAGVDVQATTTTAKVEADRAVVEADRARVEAGPLPATSG